MNELLHPSNSPRQLRPEWATQRGILLAWPHEQSDWRTQFSEINQLYLEMTAQICRFESVHIVCQSEMARDRIQQSLQQLGLGDKPVHFHVIPFNDTWIRDYGPLSVQQGNRTLWLNFGFNGWGDKYPWKLDNAVTQQLCATGVAETETCLSEDMILEGGSIEINAKGELLTTESCLLNPNRNPHMSREQIELALQDTLGAREVLWLQHGDILGDDTDGHVDTLARFCSDNVILYSACRDKRDPQYQSLALLQAQLEQINKQRANRFDLLPCFLPAAIYNAQGQRLPANYTNFLIINEAVLVPVYQDPADEAALACMQNCFPDREIIAIDSRALIAQSGSIHCATMQI